MTTELFGGADSPDTNSTPLPTSSGVTSQLKYILLSIMNAAVEQMELIMMMALKLKLCVCSTIITSCLMTSPSAPATGMQIHHSSFHQRDKIININFERLDDFCWKG